MLALRPVTDDDYEPLYALNEATMRRCVEQTYSSWDEAIARRLFAERWHPTTMRVVMVDGQDAGLLDVLPTETGLHLANIRVAPEHQGLGIGTRLISDVLRDTHGRGLSVTLRVLKVNPAHRLYERLGFERGPETRELHDLSATIEYFYSKRLG